MQLLAKVDTQFMSKRRISGEFKVNYKMAPSQICKKPSDPYLDIINLS